jgi:hypothetical protein
MITPDQPEPQPVPPSPYPAPAHPAEPREVPLPEPAGLPSPPLDPLPVGEPLGVPPESPSEVPLAPTIPEPWIPRSANRSVPGALGGLARSGSRCAAFGLHRLPPQTRPVRRREPDETGHRWTRCRTAW